MIPAMATVHPLIFEPIFRPKVWGGRNLERLFDKRLPGGAAIGESWECVDLDDTRSVVAAGPARGRTLSDLVSDWSADLLGRAPPFEGRFPLLIKFLDAVEPLSVQVHPDAETARRLGGGARPKEEAFYVVEAKPGGSIYLDVRPGVAADAFADAVRAGEVETVLQQVPAQPGRCHHVPPGTVHALGAGVVVAEIETPSDTTYRIYDWGRTRPAGDAGLHVEQALAALKLGPPRAAPPRAHVGGLFTTVTRMVDAEAFTIEKVRFIEGMEMPIPYAEMVIWIVLEGRGAVAYRGGEQPFARGDVVVLPAALRDGLLRTQSDCVWLEVTLPVSSDLADLPRPPADVLRAPDGSPAAPVPLTINVPRADRDAARGSKKQGPARER